MTGPEQFMPDYGLIHTQVGVASKNKEQYLSFLNATSKNGS